MNQTSPSMPARLAVAMLLLIATYSHAQESLTWDQVKSEFESKNPALKADALSVDEMRAEEITAICGPIHNSQQRPTARKSLRMMESGSHSKARMSCPTLSYFHEREHKRELRFAEREGRHADRRIATRGSEADARIHPSYGLCQYTAGQSYPRSCEGRSWTITTTSFRSAAIVSEPEISLRLISIGLSSSVCNTKRRSRPPSSIFEQRKSSCFNC